MKSQGLSDYRWSPLTDPQSSTRLFTLFPGSSATPIRCKLFEVELPVQHSYAALSYEWGPRTHGCAMHVDDGVVYIQKNLNAFLLQLRSRLASDQTLTLWVDAICIDQMSTEEKNHQVRMMGKIFSQAEEVISWLGPGSDHIARLFDRVMSSPLCYAVESRYNDTSGSIYESAAHARSAFQPFDEFWGNDSYEDFRSDFLALAAAGYWYRSWIVQEVVLAREISILCGTAHVSNIGVVTLFLIISRFLTIEQTDLKKMNRMSMVLLNRIHFQDERSPFERQEWTRLGNIITS